jgi:hypothetical protein
MAHEVDRPDAVAGVVATLKFVDGPLLDLAGDTGDDDVAGQLDLGLDDRPRDLDVRRDRALHVVDPGAVDPLAVDDVGMGLVAAAGQLRLLAAIGCVEVPIEDEVQAPAAVGEGSDRVIPTR